MGNYNDKYKNHYGKLVEIKKDDEIYLGQYEESYSNEILKCNFKECFYDIELENNYSDTIFFEIDENTNLILLIGKLHPDEVHNTSPNCFRLWFDKKKDTNY